MEYIEKFREQQHYNLTNLIDDFRIEASVTSFHTMVCDTKETIMNIIYGGHKKGYMRSLNFVTIWRTTIHEVELLLMIVKVIFIYHLLHIGFVCEWILEFGKLCETRCNFFLPINILSIFLALLVLCYKLHKLYFLLPLLSSIMRMHRPRHCICDIWKCLQVNALSL